MEFNDEHDQRIHYLCKDEIEKSVPQDHCFHQSINIMLSNGYPWDGFFNPTLTLMIDSCSTYPVCHDPTLGSQ